MVKGKEKETTTGSKQQQQLLVQLLHRGGKGLGIVILQDRTLQCQVDPFSNPDCGFMKPLFSLHMMLNMQTHMDAHVFPG